MVEIESRNLETICNKLNTFYKKYLKPIVSELNTALDILTE